MREGVVGREYGHTIIHPLAFLFTLAMGVWLLFVRRERAVLPILLVASLIPVAQRLVIGTLDFDMSRILILFGWARVLMRSEYRAFRRHPLDLALLAWLAAGTLVYVLREGTFGAFVYRLGIIFNACGLYFLFRLLLRSGTDVFRALRAFAVIAAIVGGFMAVEYVTKRNMFSVFGGVPEITHIRDGRMRCQGAFSHPIMAGSFGAGLAPIMLMLFFMDRKHRVSLAIGFLGATLIVITTASSGAAIAWLTALIGCALWGVRNKMRPLRISTAIILVIVHFAREGPVWQLIGRASDLIGGTGYHRVRLITGFVDHWKDWFLLGVRSTAGWGWGLQDVTNQFVLEGIRGGLLTLVAFIHLLVAAFASAGRARVRAATAKHLPRPQRRALQLLAWGLGVALATHCTSWISVSYFGQMGLMLFMLYAFIATLEQTPELREVLKPRRTGRKQPDGGRSGYPPLVHAHETISGRAPGSKS